LSESRLHLDLVSCLETWVLTCDFLGSDPMIFIDSPNSSIQKSPPTISSYRPDIFAQSRLFDREIIGEAKTPVDLDTKRSRAQLEAFIRKSSENTSRALILATRWDYVRYANSLLKQLCKENEIPLPNYAIIDQFGSAMVKSDGWL
jgi:hypothetical protein